MSENMITPSRPNRRQGWRESSAATDGVSVRSLKGILSEYFRKSGKYLPALYDMLVLIALFQLMQHLAQQPYRCSARLPTTEYIQKNFIILSTFPLIDFIWPCFH